MKTSWKRNVCVVLTAVMMMAGLTACSPNAQVPGFDISVRSADSSENGTDGTSGSQNGTDTASNNTASNNTASNNTASNNTASNNTASNNMASNNAASNNQASNNTASTLPDMLIPPGATVTSSQDGSLVLACNQPVDDTVAFYKKALKTLDAQEESVVNSIGAWSYRGSYSGGEISIVVSMGVISVRY